MIGRSSGRFPRTFSEAFRARSRPLGLGDMLGEIRLAPAILFYLLYVAGVLIFVSALANAAWHSTLLYGALFGLFCYATFDLTSLSLLKHWTSSMSAGER